MISTTQVQILDEPVYVSFRANALWKGMHGFLFFPAMSKRIGQTGLFSFDKEKKNSASKPWGVLFWNGHRDPRSNFGRDCILLVRRGMICIHLWVCTYTRIHTRGDTQNMRNLRRKIASSSNKNTKMMLFLFSYGNIGLLCRWKE